MRSTLSRCWGAWTTVGSRCGRVIASRCFASSSGALGACGCTVIRHSPPTEAPFRISAEAPSGERFGILCYAFLANFKSTRNRPDDEYRIQVKYGSKEVANGRPVQHDLWQDPFGLYTTLLMGVCTEGSFFVGYDPVLHSPTKFFISLEFKREDAHRILRDGWHTWQRAKRSREGLDEPVEVAVGGKPESFLQYVRFERMAVGLDQGHRGLLADKLGIEVASPTIGTGEPEAADVGAILVHPLLEELGLPTDELLDLIAGARRLKMAVRGWVAEEHLHRTLAALPEVDECRRLDEEGGPDIRVRLRGGPPLTIQCKNVLRKVQADGVPRIDFMRTRASQGDPCSRYYKLTDFDVVAACLHAVSELWEFRYRLPEGLPPHQKCEGRLAPRVPIDKSWAADPVDVLQTATKRALASQGNAP
jgi:hypothetical protein